VRVFFDTSSFVKRFVEEVGSEQAAEITQTASQIGLSIICFPEIISVLNRKLRAELITEEIYLELKYEIFEDIEDAIGRYSHSLCFRVASGVICIIRCTASSRCN